MYHLDKKDEQPTSPADPQIFRVCIVVADERGFFPTGCGGSKEPWYWSEEYCEEMNRRRGYTPEDVMRVVGSSMVA